MALHTTVVLTAGSSAQYVKGVLQDARLKQTVEVKIGGDPVFGQLGRAVRTRGYIEPIKNTVKTAILEFTNQLENELCCLLSGYVYPFLLERLSSEMGLNIY